MSHLDRVDLDGVELEYELRGAGDAVVLVHAGVCADFFEPLREEPALADRHRLLRYHRVGYAGSGSVDGSVSIADQAAHCGVLMRHLGVGRAHVVGHSSSAMIALQLALDAPDLVHTLALLDAARPAPRTDLQEAFVETVVQVAVRQYRTGDKAGAVDAWMRGVCGPDYASSLEKTLPGAFEQAVADADAFFGQELPAVQAWAFSREDASRVVQPALVVLGERSNPVFGERSELLLSWLPAAERFTLPGATHLLQVESPCAMAEGLADFLARHPVSG